MFFFEKDSFHTLVGLAATTGHFHLIMDSAVPSVPPSTSSTLDPASHADSVGYSTRQAHAILLPLSPFIFAFRSSSFNRITLPLTCRLGARTELLTRALWLAASTFSSILHNFQYLTYPLLFALLSVSHSALRAPSSPSLRSSCDHPSITSRSLHLRTHAHPPPPPRSIGKLSRPKSG